MSKVDLLIFQLHALLDEVCINHLVCWVIHTLADFMGNCLFCSDKLEDWHFSSNLLFQFGTFVLNGAKETRDALLVLGCMAN